MTFPRDGITHIPFDPLTLREVEIAMMWPNDEMWEKMARRSRKELYETIWALSAIAEVRLNWFLEHTGKSPYQYLLN